jgi:RNA polymerase sigma-70 factor (ECF subfamily)
MTIGEQSDEAVVRLVCDGDREAFAILVERHKRGIASFMSAALRGSADVADLCQETFLRAYAHLGSFNPQLGKFSTWLYQIARNVLRTHLDRSRKRPPLQELPEEQTLENALPDLSPEGDPEGGILRAEAERELRAALAELPERMRIVLALRYFDNLEYHAIATALGLSLANVKTLIHRGKIALAKKMRERALQRAGAIGSTRGGDVDALLCV